MQAAEKEANTLCYSAGFTAARCTSKKISTVTNRLWESFPGPKRIDQKYYCEMVSFGQSYHKIWRIIACVHIL